MLSRQKQSEMMVMTANILNSAIDPFCYLLFTDSVRQHIFNTKVGGQTLFVELLFFKLKVAQIAINFKDHVKGCGNLYACWNL